MSAKNKRQGSGRATPKGTKNPVKVSKARKSELPIPEVAPKSELRGKVAKQTQRIARPISHNRGNR